MSESQSRYSIVASLTEKKLALIRERSEMGLTVKRKEDELLDVEAKLVEHDRDVKYRQSSLQQELDNELREIEQQKRRAKASLDSVKANKGAKEDAIDEQIEAIEVALTKVEEVSKAAGQQSQS